MHEKKLAYFFFSPFFPIESYDLSNAMKANTSKEEKIPKLTDTIKFCQTKESIFEYKSLIENTNHISTLRWKLNMSAHQNLKCIAV